MHRYTVIKSLPALLLLGGCLQDLLNEGDGLVSLSATEVVVGSTTTGEPPTPTTSAGSGVQTVTGDEDSTGPSTTSSGADPGSSSGDEVNLPPTIELFDVKQDHLSEAGPAELQLIVSADVVKVKLSLDGKELAKNLKPGDFPRNWDALSAKDNGDRIFEVVVEDAEGLTAMETAPLSVLLPQPGLEKCLFEDKDANLSVIAALKYTRDAIIAVGTRDTGAGLRLTVWKLDPNHCEVVLPGWPKTIANWTGQPELGKMMSGGTAVDVDLDGNIVVAGNFIVGGKPQSYVALLNQAGSQLWAKLGQVGEEVAGVAAATAQFKNRVFVVGSQRTSDVPVRTDAAIWTYMAIDGSVSLSSWLTLKAPFTADELIDVNNDPSEWIRAVLIKPGTGNALAVGEREFFDAQGNKIYRRAFTVQVHPLGGIVGAPWTSGAPAFLHDALSSVAICGDQLVAGGWTRDFVAPTSKPQPIMFPLQADGTFIQHRHLPQLGATQLHGIACDREMKIVSAGTRTSGTSDAQVFTVTGQSDQPVWYEDGVAGNNGAGAAACDPRGFCGWAGYRTSNAKPYAVVRIHHP